MSDQSAHPNAAAAETIFNAALAFTVAERPAYLSGACGDNLSLRQRVEALLRAHEAPRGFLPERADAAPIPLTQKEGDFIGPYKLLQKIGEGGFGAVYVAEQREPVRRRVALKIIKMGMDTRQVVARFEAERQALAMMDHPNIAKVLDAGAMDSGRPYFVMELVRGVRITDFCDQKTLSTRERLNLFIQVCQAVQHAHQKGVIHRDLKPSNILVTLHDGVPVPKIIDFGIAKATQGQLTDKTVYTRFEHFIGTPAYMSPEQAEMSGLDIDTRSDIYALGVLLYELLTGRTPFDQGEMLQRGLDEMRRIIREQEAPRPSTLLGTMAQGELSAAASRRQADPPKLIHAIRGDLDWIVMRCLEKERGRRYETASGLAMDIQRHLAQEPVLACPPSAAYRLQKLVRRHKGVFAWQAVRARRAEQSEKVARENETKLRQQAQDEEKKAKQAERQARVEAEKNRLSGEVLGNTFLELVRGVYGGGNGPALKFMLNEATQRLENGSLADQPEAKAYVLSTIGRTYLQIDEIEKAGAMQREALALRKKSLGDRSPEVADSLLLLSEVLLRQGDLAGAETNYQEATNIDSRVGERNSEYMGLRGATLAQQGRWNEAADDFARAAKVAPTDYWTSYMLTPLLIQTGRMEDYRAHCAAMLKDFGQTANPRICEGTAKSCLLLPSAVGPDGLRLAARVADNALTFSKEGDWLHWRLMTKGLADYRQGRFAEALEMMGRSQKALAEEPDGAAGACEADTFFVSAMARRQLHQPGEARADLNRGLEIVQTKLPRLDNGNLGDQWFDILTADIIRREAKETVEGAPDTARNQP
jgi:serine/threonine protein kinase/tetratricopeptide (TPR) repeat protein